MKATQIDISHIPFSRYGAMVSVCRVPEKNELTIHDVRQRFGKDMAFRLFFTDKVYTPEDLAAINPKDKDLDGLPITVSATPELVKVASEKGSAEICIIGDHRISVSVTGTNLLLLAQTGYGYGIVKAGGKNYEFLFHDEFRFGTVECKKGTVCASGPVIYTRTRVERYPVDLRENAFIEAENGTIELEIELGTTECRQDPVVTKEESVAATAREWNAFLSGMPEVPSAHREFAEISWYNLWSSFVRAQDVYTTDAMLMSKKFMSSLWSWDHCFNAIAIGHVDLRKAIDQFFLPFCHQSPSGALPDMFNPDMGRAWATTKPPIHGWAFSLLMDRYEIPDADIRRAYDCLSKLTDYWMNYRDEDGDGIPAYPMGCDSGWDNATIFDTAGRFIECADLSAFLVLQMRCLARIAKHFGDTDAAESWLERSERLLDAMIAHFWDGEKFTSKVSFTHETVEGGNGCLLNYMPIVLGDLLPRDIAEKAVAAMVRNNLTEWGLATEAPESPYYEPNGYWRGPIWAPSSYLIIDGLRRMGKVAEAKEIATRFTKLCAFAAKGNYENFDALTGCGLCAPGYTWTTSVYLDLLWHYGMD